jgi:hypothetical protein
MRGRQIRQTVAPAAVMTMISLSPFIRSESRQ